MKSGPTGASHAVVKTVDTTAPPKDQPKNAGTATTGEWFYTCDGKRLGPVTFEELKTMAAKSSLHPRKDKVWREGMDVWRPAGRVESLFEASDSPSKASETTESAGAGDAESSMNPATSDASMCGVRRGTLIAAVVFAIALKLTLTAVGPIPAAIQPLALFVVLVVLIYLGMERLRNLGMNRWWVLAFTVPILNLWLGYRCLVCPAGYAHHKKPDNSSKLLTITYALLILIGLWAFWI